MAGRVFLSGKTLFLLEEQAIGDVMNFYISSTVTNEAGKTSFSLVLGWYPFINVHLQTIYLADVYKFVPLRH